MKYCEHCGEQINENDLRCPHCGFALDDESDVKIWDKDQTPDPNESELKEYEAEIIDVDQVDEQEEVEAKADEKQAEIEAELDAKVRAEEEAKAKAQEEAKAQKKLQREKEFEEKKQQLLNHLEVAGEKTGSFLKHFYQYFVQTIQSPQASTSHFSNYCGYINILLMMLLNTVPMIIAVNRINKTFKNTFTFFSVESGGFADEMAGAINLKAVLFFIITYAVLIGVSYLLIRLTTKLTKSIHELANQLGALLSVGIAVSLLSIIVALFIPLDMIYWLFFFIALPILLFIFALNFYLYEQESQLKIDKYYLLMLGHLVIILAIGMAYHFLLQNYFGHILSELL